MNYKNIAKRVLENIKCAFMQCTEMRYKYLIYKEVEHNPPKEESAFQAANRQASEELKALKRVADKHS